MIDEQEAARLKARLEHAAAVFKPSQTGDPVAPRSSDGVGRVWEMQDLKHRGPDGELSTRALSEFDCRRSAVVSLSKHPEPTAGGRSIHTLDTAGPWTRVPPNSPAATVLTMVCGP